MSAQHIPVCPHCQFAATTRPNAAGWWFGEDCTACGKRFEVKLRHDRLHDVRAVATAVAAIPAQPQ